MTLVWEDPPPEAGHGKRRALLEETRQLRASPGKWARLPVNGKSHRAANIMADNIRRGRLAAFRPAGAFEAAAAGGQVWARYVGDGGTGHGEA